MKKKHLSTLSILLASLLLFSGCGASSKYDTATETVSSMNSSASGWTEDTDTEEAAEYEMEESGTASELTESDLENRKLIKNVDITLETKEFDQLRQSLEEAIPTYGGYIQDSNFYDPQSEHRYRSYSLTIRIPSDNLDAFTEMVGELGTLTNKSEYVEDVTLTYVDMEAYKESLQVEYDKVLELLGKATDLDQILVLESKLSELRYEINSYESQLRTYDNLVAYSTVYLYISEVQYEVAVPDSIGSRISSGFMQNLYAVRDFLVDLFVFLISSLPVLLVLAVVVFILFLIIRKLLKMEAEKRQKRMEAQPYGMTSPPPIQPQNHHQETTSDSTDITQ